MRWDVIGLVLGWTIRVVCIPLSVVGIFSFYVEGQEYAIKTYLIPLILAAFVSQWFINKSQNSNSTQRVRDREAFASVALGWIPVIALGSMPFWLGGTFYGPYDLISNDASFVEVLHGLLYSWFESMSGFTTTGATLIDSTLSPICINAGQDIDCIAEQPKSILLWRSLTQWLGGIGVIMLGLLIFSSVLGGGMNLARAELTGPSLSRLGPDLQSTARILWLIYTFLTVFEIGLLYFLGDMSIFNSINYSFSTLATGGFGTSDGGIMSFDSALIESIIMVFMLLACINYSLYYLIISGRSKDALKDEELRTYLLIIFIAWLAMGFNLLRSGNGDDSFLETMRHSAFQAISISSTGYSSADFSKWPVFSQFVLLLLMIVGASAGSTGGGLKVLRIRVAFELAKREVLRIIQPKKVIAMRVNDEVLNEDQVFIVLGMISSWLVLAMSSMLFISFMEPSWSLDEVISVVVSSLGNTGPALGQFGPTATWSSMNELTIFWTSILMWFGRLELLTVLVLLHPRTWTDLN
ncbi:MAG: TrkH family potassium uptake protein [Euryarchaeota archaeon]|nr:TrkH family potassium uptake protein [Euryarchaeota archaeon]